MIEPITVLSLFDGMSCAQIALQKAGIPVKKYFASEVDKYAMQVTMKNFPNTIQLGDVRKLSGKDFPAIDLFCGGSPCQSFSFAGKRNGMTTTCEIEITSLEQYLELKEANFEFEGQSYLFWEYVRCWKEINPKWFLLENVMMSEKWERIISKTLGVNSICINSSLVSAQSRERLYWTNIGMQSKGLFGFPESVIPPPADKGILLVDVLEEEVDKKYFLSDKIPAGFLKHAERNKEAGNGFAWNLKEPDEKAATLPAGQLKSTNTYVNAVGLRSVRSEECKKIRKINQQQGTDYNPFAAKDIEERTDSKTGALLTSPTIDNAVLVIGGTLRTHKADYGFRKINNGKAGTVPGRAREDGSGQNVVSISGQIRRLTPMECERLQTVQDGYTDCVSDTQRYRMLGNGWTADVIAYIFSFLKKALVN